MPASDTVIALARGHYRLRTQVGRSVYGTVWRAAAPGGRPDVALKLVNSEQMALAPPGQRERWISAACNEIAFLQAIGPWDGHHIARMVDSGWHAGLPVLALELLPTDLGCHLRRRRAAGMAPDFLQALDWIGQLNQALAKVHQYGWRHLDLKPANILVDPATGTLRLTDFGTGRPLADSQPHSYAGTAQWQAPEQFLPTAAGGYATGRPADYYSLGALFYFLVTGAPLRSCTARGDAYRVHLAAGTRQPPQAPDGAALAGDEAACFTAVIPPPARRPALALLEALLATQPQARPRHALQISRMLGAIAAQAAPVPAPVVRACALAA